LNLCEPIHRGLFVSPNPEVNQLGRKLGIIAGRGEWPRRLADACREQGRGCFVVALKGFCDVGSLNNLDYIEVELGAVGKTLKALKDHGCEDVVLAGPIDRPSLSTVKPDLRALALMPKLLKARGDNALLSVLVEEFESDGFAVVGIDDVMNDVLANDGAMGEFTPDTQQLEDIHRGVKVVATLGILDIGQAVVVQQGFVLGVEAAEGTDALIERCGPMKRPGSKAVMVKMAKPDQDRRADLPTIGLDTVKNAIKADFAGIAVEKGGVIVAEREEVIRAADEAGLFLFGVDNPKD
jgi:UDP-2,3-diacylglucosamine hydrolase